MATRGGLVPEARRRGGVFFKLLVFLVVVAAFVAMAWMLFLPVVLTQQIRERTGCGATVERFAIDPVSGQIELRGLVLTNPPDFPAAGFVDLREFTADAEVASLLSRQPVFAAVTVHIAEVTLVKRADGLTNVEAFDRALMHPASEVAPASPAPVSPPAAEAPESGHVLIRRLTVKIDRLTVADYTGATPRGRSTDIGFDRTYTNVKDLEALLGPSKLGEFAPLGAIAERLIPGIIGREVREVLRSGGDFVKETSRKTEEKVRGLFDGLEETRKP